MLNRIIPNLTKNPRSRRLWRRFPFGSTPLRVSYGALARAHYAYGVYAAANLARRLKIDKISVIELGVGGQRGLLVLKAVAEEVSRALKSRISVNGFDTGSGCGINRLPRFVSCMGEVFYRIRKLRFEHLEHAQLIDNVAETVCLY